MSNCTGSRPLVSSCFEFGNGHVLMINRGLCSECVAVAWVRTDSAGNCSPLRPEERLSFRSLGCGANLPLLFLLAISIAMAGCAITGTKASESDSSTPTVSVSLVQQPPSCMSVGGTVSVSATVSNDAANAGVDWVAMCGSAPQCGSFSPAHSANGAATTFTAPLGVPASNTVAVTALSSTDHSKTSAATVTITSNVTGVTITTQLPPAFPSGGTLTALAATVDGDPSNAGVNWKATCDKFNGFNIVPGDCTAGFNGLTHSAPGSVTTFTVPLESDVYPTIVGSTVTLTAVAAADHNFSASATFTVTGPISLDVTQAPPTNVLTNASVPVAATVTDDPTDSGVTWTILSCDVRPCGSWSATSTTKLTTQVASGATVTYTAPPTALGHVNIQVAATASPATVQVFTLSVTAPISIAITQGVPNNTIATNHSAPLVATVSDDSANGGVDWTVTCAGPGPCGSFSLLHTASGATTTFNAPSAVPTPNTVTIIATSTDQKKTTSETETVTANVLPISLLNGNWVMALSGRDANGGPFALGGVITGNGIGQITSGSLDLVDLPNQSGLFPLAVSPSTYSIGADGRGQIRLTLDTSFLQNGTYGVNGSGSIVLSVVFVTSKHALLSETDTFGSGTGTLDLQNADDVTSFLNKTAGLNGVYSLSLTGADLAGSNPKYLVTGAVDFQSQGGSYSEISYIVDQSDNGAITSLPLNNFNNVPHVVSGSQILPNPNGELMLKSVDLGLPLSSPTPFSLNAWIIDAQHFVVTDPTDPLSGAHPMVMIGYLTVQPNDTTMSGTYAFTEAGVTAGSVVPQVAGGIFTCGSTGELDVTLLNNAPVNNNPINVTCGAPVNGRSLITISGASPTGISQFAAYTTVDQGLYLVELDGGADGSAGPSGAGVARQQTLAFSANDPSNFGGKYASSFLADMSRPTQPPLFYGFEAFAAQIVSDGVSTLLGKADVNSFTTQFGLATPSSNADLSGSSFTVGTGTNGRFPLVLIMPSGTGQPLSTINPACYIMDPNTCLLLGLDPTVPGTGILELQQNLGL
jgi:hypothetical protein